MDIGKSELLYLPNSLLFNINSYSPVMLPNLGPSTENRAWKYPANEEAGEGWIQYQLPEQGTLYTLYMYMCTLQQVSWLTGVW